MLASVSISSRPRPEVSDGSPRELEKSGTCQLYSPNRTARIEGAFCFHEGRDFAAKNPDVRVWGLLSHQMCEQPGETSDFHFHNVVHGFVMD